VGYRAAPADTRPPGDGRVEDAWALPDGLKLPEKIVVQPLFGALAGPRWNEYVKTKLGSGGSRTPTSELCDAAAKSYEDCVHAGELRRVELDDVPSCQGLTLEDSLGAFDWTCVEAASGVRFESRGLRPGRGLGDLVTASGWRPMSVTLRLGSLSVVSSAASEWWENPVLPVPPGGGVVKLDQPGAVYVLSSTRKTAGCDVLADQVSVVTLPGVRFEADATAPARCADVSWNGQPTAARCLINAKDRRQLWVEVSYESLEAMSMHVVFLDGVRMSVARNIDAGTKEHYAAVRLLDSTANRITGVFGRRSDYGEVTLRTSHHNRVEGVTSLNGYSATIVLDSSAFNRLTSIQALNDDGTSVELVNSDDNRLEDLQIVYAEGHSVSLSSSHRNRIVGLRSMDADGDALSLKASDDNVITGLRSAGNTVTINGADNTLTDGIISGSTWPGFPASSVFLDLTGATGTTVAFVTLTNLAGTGILGDGTTDTTLHKVVVANTAGHGLHFKDSSQLRCSDLAIAHTDGDAVRLETVSDVAFDGLVTLSGSCHVSAPQQTGIQHQTCALVAPSSGTLQRNVSLAASFHAKVTADDAANPVDTDGTGKLSYTWSLPATGFESYFAFDNPLRVWGGDGQTFPHASNRESCRPAASCRIWDLRLRASDKVLRDSVARLFPSAVTPVPGKPCPAPLGGDRTVRGLFLSHAVELRGDERGDDDGLCETGEACLYAPNTGAYQGESALAKGCVFQGGAVGNVEVHWHTQNGVP
jgi:hypothetical protein